jgi:hypothetical protein
MQGLAEHVADLSKKRQRRLEALVRFLMIGAAHADLAQVHDASGHAEHCVDLLVEQ